MSPNEAKRILKMLADGIDPETGEILPTTSVFNGPQAIRAFFVAITALEKSIERATKRAKREDQSNGANAGQPWSDAEDKNLLAIFDSNKTTISDIATMHGRTQGAIAARLVRLGRIQDRTEVYVRSTDQSQEVAA